MDMHDPDSSNCAAIAVTKITHAKFYCTAVRVLATAIAMLKIIPTFSQLFPQKASLFSKTHANILINANNYI